MPVSSGSNVLAMNAQVSQLTRHTIPLGGVAGIPIGLDYSWFLIFGLLIWLLATRHFPAEFPRWAPSLYWLVGAATAILFFVSVLLHELGHSAVARRYRVSVRSITLFVFGGVSQMDAEPPSAGAEFRIAVAGPLVSFALAALFYALQAVAGGIRPLYALAEYLAYINLALAVFNLIPGYPLDGGRVFRAIVWAIIHDLQRATLIAAAVGRGFGFLFIAIGVWQLLAGNLIGGLWIAFIGWFLESAAAAQTAQVVIRGALAGHTVSQAMSGQCPIVPGNLTLQELVERQILGAGQRSFLVNRGGTVVGLMTLARIRQVPQSNWATTTVEHAMLPLEGSKRVAPDTPLSTAMELMARDSESQLPVMSNGKAVGVLTREDAVTFLNTLRQLGLSNSTPTSSVGGTPG
jgi:Zn-dependent protease/CBS domain-containing protein